MTPVGEARGAPGSQRWRRYAGFGFVAALGAVALLAINDPGAFTGSRSPWSVALQAAIYGVALVAALIFFLNDSERGSSWEGTLRPK